MRPVAWAGDGAGVCWDTAKITWADVERGQGPIGHGDKDRRAADQSGLRDESEHGAMAQGCSSEVGFASSMALPLKDASGVLGALAIYAAEPDAFNTDEVALLT